MRILDILLDLLFPGLCVGCRATLEGGADICADCFSKIPFFGDASCLQCARRLPFGKKHCHENEPTVLVAATSYEDARVSSLVQDLKFRNVKYAARPLSDLMARAFLRSPFAEGTFVLVPIPLPARRQRRRGYNQAQLLADQLSRKLSLPLETGLLKRVRETPAQTTLPDRAARIKNAAGSFAVCERATSLPRKILLVDDVSTTGSTLREAARCLKQAGVEVVVSLVAARA